MRTATGVKDLQFVAGLPRTGGITAVVQPHLPAERGGRAGGQAVGKPLGQEVDRVKLTGT
jgi:hypothetical protein